MHGSSKAFQIAAFAIAAIVTGALVYEGAKSGKDFSQAAPFVRIAQTQTDVSPLVLKEKVIPSGGMVLPVRWGDLGKKLVVAGVIDEAKFEALYASNNALKIYAKTLLTSGDNGQIAITKENSGIILNALWAFGLGNKNPILENGPIQDPRYGSTGRFASTGGWTLMKGNAMDHFSKYDFVALTAEEQALVERVSKNIYRPCCNNSTYFPDCNHGMAMLGLLELMASQGVPEDQMYKTALVVNSYWFPDNYLTIANYFSSSGVSWDAVDPKEILGAAYSSASGYRNLLAKINNAQGKPAVSCGVK